MLSADAALRLAGELGLRLGAFRPAGSGKGRTYFAETPDGLPVVVKWYADGPRPLPEAIAHSEELVRRGYPTARTLAHGPALGGYGVVQERLPGTPALPGPGPALLDDVRAAVELQDSGGGRGGGPRCWAAAVVRDDAMGWWGGARARSPRAAELCDRLAAWVHVVPAPLPRADYVFYDFNFTNILTVRDRLSGIVDIDLLARGDRSLDLACLAFEYELLRGGDGRVDGHPVDPVGVLAEDILRISGVGGWRQAVTYLAIAHLGWVGPAGQRDPWEPCLAAVERLISGA